jgi:hypothetical protein
MITYHKPGTMQQRLGRIEDAEYLKNFGWVPMEEVIVLRPPKTKKAVSPEPTAPEEVGNNDNTQGD